MNWHRVIGASLIVLLLCSCKKKPEPITESTPSNISGTVPDVGRVDTVPTEAVGYGATPAAATSDAMKTAILQVNGATIDTGSIQAKYGLDVTDGQDSVSLRATAFAELVAQKSGGAITNFKIKTVEDPAAKGGPFKITIEASIAHFTPPSDKKIRVVVAPVRFDSSSFIVGSTSVPAQKVSDDIAQQVSTALTETGRFSVLNRDSSADIAQELDMIENGQAPRAEGETWTGSHCRCDLGRSHKHARLQPSFNSIAYQRQKPSQLFGGMGHLAKAGQCGYSPDYDFGLTTRQRTRSSAYDVRC
jgi:hypothetical protein